MALHEHKKSIIQFIRFNLVGVLNTAVDFGVYSALTALGMDYMAAQVISYCCGVLNSYFFNTLWTFSEEKKRTGAEFVKFVAVNLVSLGVSLLALYICREKLGIQSDILCKLIATPVSLVVNFAGNKLFVFKNRE